MRVAVFLDTLTVHVLCLSLPAAKGLQIIASSPRNSRCYFDDRRSGSPDDLSSSTDTLDESSPSHTGYEPQITFNNGHQSRQRQGHNRNSSADEITLQQLRMGGILYQQQDGEKETGEARFGTMSRLQKGRIRELRLEGEARSTQIQKGHF